MKSNPLFKQFLHECLTQGASDLHLSVAVAPALRIHGELKTLGQPLSAAELQTIAQEILDPARREQLSRQRNLDFSYALDSGERFRVNAYHERGHLAFAVRRLADRIAGYATLGLPSQLSDLCRLNDGLVLVTGPTGSGKTTTLASMIDEINRTRRCHILTIEDPIEYVHDNRKALVHQRELGEDVLTFSDAVRAALREDPDVILVGELRDLETMRAAVTAAETGHLVFATLHSGDTVSAIDRLIGAFPAQEQESIRHQLALVLRAVVTQHLLPASTGRGRVPIVELLLITTAVAALIRQNKPRQILSIIETSSHQGMQTHDSALATLTLAGRVDESRARLAARDTAQFEQLLNARRQQRREIR